MPASIFNGAISFGLVSVPIAVVSATEDHSVSCHLLGIEGCAAHLPAPPPLLDGHQSTDADAWRCYGHILFWLNRPGLGPHERDTRCAPLWEHLTGPFLGAAVDPLHQFQYAAMGAQDIRTSTLGRIIDAFPAQARTVLHHGLHATTS